MPISDELLEKLHVIARRSPEVWTAIVEGRDHLGGESFIAVTGSDDTLDEIYLSLHPGLTSTRDRYHRDRQYLDLVAAAGTHFSTLIDEVRAARGLTSSHGWVMSTEDGLWCFNEVDARVAAIEVGEGATLVFPGFVRLVINRECTIEENDRECVSVNVADVDSLAPLLQLRTGIVTRAAQTPDGGIAVHFAHGAVLRVEPEYGEEAFSLSVPGVGELYAMPFNADDEIA